MSKTDVAGVNGNHYSNEDLMKFKGIILKKLERARFDLKDLSEALFNGNGTDDTSPTFKNIGEGKNALNREENEILKSRQEKIIKHLEYALIRIENKTYGICRITGQLIPEGRLRATPHATTCIEGKNILQKEEQIIPARFRQAV